MYLVHRATSGLLLLLFLVIALSSGGCGSGGKTGPATPGATTAEPSPPVDETPYPIKLFVPAKVGQQRLVDIAATQVLERTTVKDGKVQEEQKSRNLVEFKAKVETLAVNEQGQETKRLIAIEKLVLTPEGGKVQEAMPTGFVLTAETVGGRTVYQPRDKNQKLSRLAEHLLPRIFGNETGAIEDQMFPVSEPQKIGATWPADKKFVLAQFKGMGATSQQLNASAKLVGVKQINGQQVLELEMDMRVQSPGPSEPEMDSKELAINVNRHLLTPADYSSGPIEEYVRVTMKQTLEGKPGSSKKDILLEGRSTDTTTRKTTYLK